MQDIYISEKIDFASKVVVFFNVMPTSNNQAINIEILYNKTAAYCPHMLKI